MKRFASIAYLLFALPFIASAQGLQAVVINLIAFVNRTFIPVLLGLAFLFFIINAVRFFIFQGTTVEGKDKAKQLAIYGVLAFVILIVFWGVVNLLAQSIGLERKTAPTPDYVKMNGGNFVSPSPTRSSGSEANSGGDGGAGSSDPIGDIIRNSQEAVDPNCPNGPTGLGLDGRPCGIY